MKYSLRQLCCFLVLLLAPGTLLWAQDGSAKPTEKEEEGKKVRFNGLGRTILNQTAIDGSVLDSDTSTIQRQTDGEFLLDLALNATPNDNAEIQAILRLRNEFGGFFGAGVSVEVRELWARGIIADAVEYRAGDMDHVMTPYTFFNVEEEGRINEATAFAPLRDVINYEQFYQEGNTRRIQGAKLDFGLDFTQILNEIDLNAFAARIRGTDFFTVPTRFIAGGQAQFSTDVFDDSLGLQADFGLNLIHTFDDLRSGNATAGIRNTVTTLSFDVTIIDRDNLGLHLVGETGQSNLQFKQNRDSMPDFEEDDTFLDAGLQLHLKPQKLKVGLSFIDVGPDFFSIGAQSKRIDFEAEKTYYNRLGENRDVRMPSTFDLTRDRALYTFRLSDRLGVYDPRFSNALPYGTATPNRRGLRFNASYGSEADELEVFLDGALLNELRGQGTFELKSFALIRAAANLNIHRWADWKNNLRLTLGYLYEQTNRDGVEVEQIDLTSNLLELGFEFELFTNFELLAGAKLLSASGTEYVPLIEEFNDVRDFPTRLNFDDTETLIAAGFKYTFKKGIYLTLQYQSFESQLGTNNPNDYQLQQFFAIYNMNF